MVNTLQLVKVGRKIKVARSLRRSDFCSEPVERFGDYQTFIFRSIISWVSAGIAIVCFAGCENSSRDNLPSSASPAQETSVTAADETTQIDAKALETKIEQVQVTFHVPNMCERLKLL